MTENQTANMKSYTKKNFTDILTTTFKTLIPANDDFQNLLNVSKGIH